MSDKQYARALAILRSIRTDVAEILRDLRAVNARCDALLRDLERKHA